MKKRILQCLSLILCAAMLAIPAAAAETADEEAPARLGPAAYWGTVTWMDEDTFLLDSGKELEIDLALWLETTRKRGGLVSALGVRP